MCGRVLPSPDDVDDLSHGERPPGKIQSRAAELRPASGTLCLAFAGLRRRARDLCSRNASHSRANLTTCSTTFPGVQWRTKGCAGPAFTLRILLALRRARSHPRLRARPHSAGPRRVSPKILPQAALSKIVRVGTKVVGRIEHRTRILSGGLILLPT
jgi:hypothetical protein